MPDLTKRKRVPDKSALHWISFGMLFCLASVGVGAYFEVFGHLHEWIYKDGCAIGFAAVIVGARINAIEKK